MKAHEAPEKIWMSDDTEAIWVTNPSSTRFIEYIRTDVFIKKACEFLNSSSILRNTRIVKWFKEYMKGE